jgi:hypothetical protein
VSATVTNEISDWLEELGMAEYAKVFAENRVDVSVLPELTDLDLAWFLAIGAKSCAQSESLAVRPHRPNSLL